MRVEIAHRAERRRESRMPGAEMLARPAAIDERHARLPGPAQDLYLGHDVLAERCAAVDHVQDRRARQHGPEQLAFFDELAAARERLPERRDARPALIRAGALALHPGQGARGIFEARRVDQTEQDLAL